MSAKRAKVERKEAAATVVKNDPGALDRARLEYMRLAGAVDGGQSVLAVLDQAITAAKEALGVTKANLRTKQGEIETLTKAAKAAEANGQKKAAEEAEATAA